ncbi:hypothetical protein NSB25_06700 [Acetatifactor muris]|uniref:Uncharacterized protein n=1 Tax=Acetatifactor muris TaxID=879566 RepID=A0A2K4ZDB8_9FIRM|nr:hypothetical protein [Acetatifactor muris]MCR2046969.1 hypothetical protein [Acetatifactor muris]SOY28440.1 hypothetical protein AMURIS_01147 [Acetatifactor muris]
MHVRILGISVKSKQILFFCVYRILLDIVYINGVAPTYRYSGFVTNKNFIVNIISWIVFLIYAVRLITVEDNKAVSFSKTVIFTLFLLIYTPFSVLISNGMYDYKYAISNNIYWFILIFFFSFKFKTGIRELPHFVIGNQKIGEKFINIFGFASLALVLLISWKYTGFRINLSILNVYELRSDAANFNLPTLLRYMFGWTRIINSIFFCLSLIRGKKIRALVYFINQVLSFGIDGMKSSMFILVLDIFIFFLYKLNLYKNSLNLLTFGFNLASIGAILEMVIINTKWLVYLIFFRMEFLPVHIGSQFYDFFTTHEPDFFRSSFLRWFGATSPYENINYMISGLYSGDYSSEANNGLISDAITNMGYIGIIIMPVILVLFFRLFDRCSQGINEYLILTLGVYCAITLSNMFFLPSLLTGGWLVATIIVLLIDRERTDLKDSGDNSVKG